MLSQNVFASLEAASVTGSNYEDVIGAGRGAPRTHCLCVLDTLNILIRFKNFDPGNVTPLNYFRLKANGTTVCVAQAPTSGPAGGRCTFEVVVLQAGVNGKIIIGWDMLAGSSPAGDVTDEISLDVESNIDWSVEAKTSDSVASISVRRLVMDAIEAETEADVD